MKITVLSFMLLFVSLAAGQTVVPNNTEWKNFTSPDEEFSVEVPAGFQPVFSRLPSNDKKNPRGYYGTSANNYFYAFSDDPGDLSMMENVLKFFKPTMLTAPAEKFYGFSGDDGFYHYLLVLPTAKRVYLFQAISPQANDALARRFFSSLKINGSQPEILGKLDFAKTESVVIQNPENILEANTGGGISNGRSAGAGSGSGTGIGNGIGSGIGTGAENNSGIGVGRGSGGNSSETTALKVLSKPRPVYTIAARFYQIQGTVSLRVTFLANGTIGAVSPINKLPFGLNAAAIDAAKKLRFTPQMKDGKPFFVTKVVQYNFTLY